jgi:hypothetical protein
VQLRLLAVVVVVLLPLRAPLRVLLLLEVTAVGNATRWQLTTWRRSVG